MCTRIFTLLAISLFLTPVTQAQVALEMQPIESNSTITSVTLYRNRAAVTRTATLELGAGGHSVFFRDLPSTVYLDSVQARISDNASLLSVDTSSKPTLVDNSEIVAELVAKIKEVQAKSTAAQSKEDAIALQIEMLKTLLEKASNDKAPPVDIEAFETQLAFIGKKMEELSASKAANSKLIQELKEIRQKLEQEKRNISGTTRKKIDAIVDIGVVSAATIEVHLTYLVGNATWVPVYSMHANAKGTEITIDYDAELTQRTGENWTDVALTLSTAQPQQSITPPMPRPWYVDVYVPEPAAPTATRSNKQLDDSSVSLGASFSGGLSRYALGKEVEVATKSAGVVGDGPAVSFVLPRTVTVPSDLQDKQTTSVSSISTSATHYLIAVPMLTDRVFVRSEVTNKSDYILLPGRASIFHGSDYVGKTSLETISPDEVFTVDLGINPLVLATRTLIEKHTSSTGLFSSGRQTLYEYQISLSNGSDEQIEVRVFDRVPVSQNEEIEVFLKNLSTPLSTDPAYLQTDRQQGILRWDMSIPANCTGEQSVMLTWQVEIARSKDIELTPLPE